MQEKDILKLLKNLQELKPKQEWVAQNRLQLLSQLNAQIGFNGNKEDRRKLKNISLFLPQFLTNSIVKPAGIIALVLAVLSGGFASVSASSGSVPGDILYPIKITKEKMKLSVAPDDKQKTSLHIEFANERLNELDKITKTEPKKEKQNQKAQKAIKGYKKEIDDVKKSLEQVKSVQKSEEAVKVAKMVTEKTEEFSKTLDTKKQEVPEIKKDIKEAIAASDEANEKAVDVIIEKHVAGDTSLSQEEVVKTIENKLNKTKDKIIELDQHLSEKTTESSSGEKTQEQPVKTEQKTSGQTEQNKDTPLTDNTKTINNSTDTNNLKLSEDAKKSLDQAQELLQKGELTGAFELVKETTKIVKSAEDILENIAENSENGYNTDLDTKTGDNTAVKPAEITENAVNSEENTVNSNTENQQPTPTTQTNTTDQTQPAANTSTGTTTTQKTTN